MRRRFMCGQWLKRVLRRAKLLALHVDVRRRRRRVWGPMRAVAAAQ